MVEYYQIWMSAETIEDSKEALEHLTSRNLIVGGTILNGPTHFWWDNKQIDMDYYYIMGFTQVNRREELEKEYESISKEDIPMISFIKMDGNKLFLDFISKYTSS